MTKRFACRHFVELIYLLVVITFLLVLSSHFQDQILSNYQNYDKNDFLHSYHETQHAFDIIAIGTNESCYDHDIYPAYMAKIDLLYPQKDLSLYSTVWKNSKICLQTRSSIPTFAPRTIECGQNQFRCQDYCFYRYGNEPIECPIIDLTVETIDNEAYDPKNMKQFQYGDQTFEYKVVRAIPNNVDYPENPKPFIVSLGVNSQENIAVDHDVSFMNSYDTLTQLPTQNGFCVSRDDNGARHNNFPTPREVSRECDSYDEQYIPIDTYPGPDETSKLPTYTDIPADLHYSEAYFVIESFRKSASKIDADLDLEKIRKNTLSNMIPTLYRSFQMPVNPMKCYEAGVMNIRGEIDLFFNTDDTGLRHFDIVLFNLFALVLLILCAVLFILGYIIMCCRGEYRRIVENDAENDASSSLNSRNVDNSASLENSNVNANITHKKSGRCTIFNLPRLILLSQIPFISAIMASRQIYIRISPLTKAADILQNSGCVLGEFQEMLQKFRFLQRFENYEPELFVHIGIISFFMVFGILLYTIPCIFERGEVCCCCHKKEYGNDGDSDRQAHDYSIDNLNDGNSNNGVSNAITYH